jgi:hypothetical protein
MDLGRRRHGHHCRRRRFDRRSSKRHDVVGLGRVQQAVDQRQRLVGRERPKVLRRPIDVRIPCRTPTLCNLVDAKLAPRDRFPLRRTTLDLLGVALALQPTERTGEPVVVEVIWGSAVHDGRLLPPCIGVRAI